MFTNESFNCSSEKKPKFSYQKTIVSNGRKVSFRSSLSNEDLDNYLYLNDIQELKNNNIRLLKKKADILKFKTEEWLDQHKFDIYLTITLRKSITSDSGTPWYIQQENIESTSNELLFGITRKLNTRRKRLNFAVFLEYQCDGRPHLHILLSTPRKFSFHRIQSKIHSVLIEADWVYRQWDIQSVYDQNGVLKYNLKTGFSAFQPMSCSISE